MFSKIMSPVLVASIGLRILSGAGVMPDTSVEEREKTIHMIKGEAQKGRHPLPSAFVVMGKLQENTSQSTVEQHVLHSDIEIDGK